MLPTLVIGLREGLEAALIVGIIATFLRTNGKSLRMMWIGVSIAVGLSIAVGVILEVVSLSLPQSQQEGLETIIGAVAVVFVTGMIVWMSKHARHMKSELESSARAALGEGSTWALAVMAFLAVLKEGFETSVFLLATFQSSSSVTAAVAGAIIGILIAVLLGIGIYKGGVRLNLGKFFKATGVFLNFVAAGLVVSALRTAHEAGWINIGQQTTVDLSWLAPPGSIQAALITGVLGIPADPRVIEVLGWFLYLVPVLAFTLWPAAWKPQPRNVFTVQFAIAGGLALAAVLLVVLVPAVPEPAVIPSAPISAPGEPVSGSASLSIRSGDATLTVRRKTTTVTRFPASSARPEQHAGIASERWQIRESGSTEAKPKALTVGDLVALEGGRLPVGFDAQQNPGPFDATWSDRTVQTLWTVHNQLLDATSASTSVVTISGGGLLSPRVLSVDPGTTGDWHVTTGHVTAVSNSFLSASMQSEERALWRLWLPLILLIGAVILAASGARSRSRLRPQNLPVQPETGQSVPAVASPVRNTHYATK